MITAFRTNWLQKHFLASVETMLATFANIELVILQPKIQIHIKETKEDSSLCKGDTNTEYIFYVNHETLTDLVYWNCFVYFYRILYVL